MQEFPHLVTTLFNQYQANAPNPQEMMFLMEAFDANQDGRLDLDEFLEMLVSLLA